MKNMCMNERRAARGGTNGCGVVRTGAGRYEQARGDTNDAGSTIERGGVRTSTGGYEHSRGSSRGYVPLVPRPPPPPTNFLKFFFII